MRHLPPVLLLFLFLSCGRSPSDEPPIPLPATAADSLWLEFAVAMETSDTAFLLANSLDTIECVDCVLGSTETFFPADTIFKNYLDKLMHLPSLSDRRFSTQQGDSIIRVGYAIEWPPAPDGGYSVIFTLRNQNDHFILEGMFFVP